MNSVLFLCHRLPYPPDKGDKIRSYNILKSLASRYRVRVGTFVDAPEDWQHVERIRGMVEELEVHPINTRLATVMSASGFLSGEPLSVRYYRNAKLARWVKQVLARNEVECAYVFSSAMGQFIPRDSVRLSIMDFCDLDSAKWELYSQSRRWPLSWVYSREARLLEQYERVLASSFDRSFFVSESESASFCSRSPELSHRVSTLRMGVNVEFFDPSLSAEFTDKGPATVVFTGAMDYWANVDAVNWFVDCVWGRILSRFPSARFVIVGSRPTSAVLRLGSRPGVTVTGTVPDVRPYLSRAAVAVAPLRIARGIQSKVLEAMAMARPVVATPAALQGLDERWPECVRCASSAEDFAAAVVDVLGRGCGYGEPTARQFVIENYSWTAALKPLWSMLDQSQGPVGAVGLTHASV